MGCNEVAKGIRAITGMPTVVEMIFAARSSRGHPAAHPIKCALARLGLSEPYEQYAYSAPGPPSSQSPSLAYPHESEHVNGAGGDGGGQEPDIVDAIQFRSVETRA
eukprot:404966-Prymnesium_polylepis.2